jgi:pre-mRNA-splicing factor 38B
LWTWYEPYLDDEEEVDVRAGGGHPMTIGQIVRALLTKLDWFSTLFPRIPVPISVRLHLKDS